MKYDLIVSGVGGQGILSISFVVDNAALEQNLRFKQAEVHGMAQRGGAVVSHLRISDGEIFSDLVPFGKGDLVLSMEPLESLRYVDYLSKEGMIVTSSSSFINIPNYPELAEIIESIQKQNHVLVNAEALARDAGSNFAQNMVMLGAASSLIPIENSYLEKYIAVLFKPKGEKIIEVNIRAFRNGALAADNYRKLLASKLPAFDAWRLANKIAPADYDDATYAALIAIAGKDGFFKALDARKKLFPISSEILATLKEVDFNDYDLDEITA
jgi:indolepyruvate ferredoxin oxidoreductase beta subunit